MARERFKVGRIDDPIWNEPYVPPHPRRRQIRHLVFIAVVTVVVGYTAIAAGLSRRDYGTFSFWGPPARINVCGRRYYPGPTLHVSRQSLMAQVSGHPSWKTVGHTFLLRPIEAPVSGPGSRDSPPLCTMTLYLPTFTGGGYVSYELSGGP